MLFTKPGEGGSTAYAAAEYLPRASTAYKRRYKVVQNTADLPVSTFSLYGWSLLRSDGCFSMAGEVYYSHYFILVESFISLTFCRNFDYYCEISTANIYIYTVYIFVRYRENNLFMKQLQLISLRAVVLAKTLSKYSTNLHYADHFALATVAF